jgi:hypothetical protein
MNTNKFHGLPNSVVWIRNHLDADPDPACHFNADPDPDRTFPFDADPEQDPRASK